MEGCRDRVRRTISHRSLRPGASVSHMSSGLFLSMSVLLALVAWGVVVFNRFVALRNRYQNAYAQIDVQLKRRYDLIPNLVSATRAYLTHERQTLEAVTAARQRASDANDAVRAGRADLPALAALDSAEVALASPLGRLIALAEQYPELQADETVHRLTEELRSTENRIGFARQAF